MKRMSIVLAAALSCAAYAQEEAPQTAGTSPAPAFGAWRVSAGANFGFGLKTRMTRVSPTALYPVSTSPYMGSGADIASRLASGREARFLNGAYINPNGSMASPYTQNWRVPASALDRTTGSISLESAQLDPAVSGARNSDDSNANGVSLELSRTLFEKRGFGLDLAFGLSWLRADNCFRMRGGGDYLSRTGYIYTPSAGNINAMVLTSPRLAPEGGYYGAGSSDGMGTVLDWSDLGEDTISAVSERLSYKMDASGDYEEWELSFMLRPWYEVTDWFRLNATAGLGVTRSEFDYSVFYSVDGAAARSVHRSEDEWRAYGIVGVGVLMRAWMFDVSLDVLARIGQRDMDIDCEAMHGKVEKPDLFVRLAIGFEF